VEVLLSVEKLLSVELTFSVEQFLPDSRPHSGLRSKGFLVVEPTRIVLNIRRKNYTRPGYPYEQHSGLPTLLPYGSSTYVATSLLWSPLCVKHWSPVPDCKTSKCCPTQGGPVIQVLPDKTVVRLIPWYYPHIQSRRIHIYKYICIHAYAYIYIYIYVYIYVYIYIYIYMYVYIYIYIYIYRYIYVHIYIYICIYVCISCPTPGHDADNLTPDPKP